MHDAIIPQVGERTKLNRANSNSPSLRTTIPESVVNELKVKEGDSIEWERIVHEGKIAIRIKKAEK
jgi:antitoxin component of MazEF toxin-antitoxin module